MRKLFPVPFVLWAVVTVAWFIGLNGVAFIVPNTGESADIDFNRKYDHTAVALTPSVVWLDGGQVLTVKRAWIPWCWLCGTYLNDEPLMPGATHRDGAWIYRAPEPDPNFTGWTNSRGIAAALTYALNLDTGERLTVEKGSSLESKGDRIAAKGLVLDDAHRLDRPKYEPASMLAEGCAIVQTAFFTFLAVWSLVFGALALKR